MRTLLVFNPSATATTARTRDLIARALGSAMEIEVAGTEGRGHAAELAAKAAAAGGVDLVVVLGGDGTVNEVVNGLLTGGPVRGAPALAVLPGGSTNVFARNLGLPESPYEAAGQVLEAVRLRRRRRIGLGRADERWFTFTAGLGFDAEVVREIENRRRSGVGLTAGRYTRAAVLHHLRRTDRRHPALSLQRPGEETVQHLFMAIVANSSPWTYWGRRPLLPTPEASFDAGLDLLALRRMGVPSAPAVLLPLLSSRPSRGSNRTALRLHDLSAFTLVAARPTAVQVDGEYVGERERVAFTAVPQALDVIA